MSSSTDFTGARPEHSGDGAPTSARTGSSDHELVAETVFRAKRGEDLSRPLFLSRIAAGFPSPADDYIETTLDLNDELISNETATFFLKVSGTSMTGIGIHDGDTIIVDRSSRPAEMWWWQP